MTHQDEIRKICQEWVAELREKEKQIIARLAELKESDREFRRQTNALWGTQLDIIRLRRLVFVLEAQV